MSVIEALANLAEQARGYPPNLGERHTETYLVQPFIEALGYHRLNRAEVEMQYPVQVASRTFLCDYAIKRDGEPIILIECKKTETGGNRGTRRSMDARAQLSSYFVMCPSVWLGIYTTGFEYHFYSGYLENGARKMDDEPFLTLNLLNFDEGVAGHVAAFAKGRFDPNEVQGLARYIRDRQKVENALREELRSPSDGLVRLLMDSVGAEQDEFDRYQPIVQEIAPPLLIQSAIQRPLVPAAVAPSSASRSGIAAAGTPAGIEIHWVNRGQTYEAILLEHGHGRVWVDGQECSAPSAACQRLLPRRPANGWAEWEYFDQYGQDWLPIGGLRGLSDEEQIRRAGASIGFVAPPQPRSPRRQRSAPNGHP